MLRVARSLPAMEIIAALWRSPAGYLSGFRRRIRAERFAGPLRTAAGRLFRPLGW